MKRYAQLGWANILDALAFSYDNEDLIEADMDRERALLDGLDSSPAPPSKKAP